MSTKKMLYGFCAAALLMGCSSEPENNGGDCVFQGRFIGYNNEYVEFFLPSGDGEYLELPIKVNGDGSFRDTVHFERNYYDYALFADKFMFRVYLEPGKNYTAEFDLREEGVETNFFFYGEGAVENEYMKHLWKLDQYKALDGVRSFKECRAAIDAMYAPLKAELATIDNKAFVKYNTEHNAEAEKLYSFFFPFYSIKNNGVFVDDADFAAFVKKNRMSDEEFAKLAYSVFVNMSYTVNMDATEALKAAASCTVKPAQKEVAMTQMLTALVGAGNTYSFADGYEYYKANVGNEELKAGVAEMCESAISLSPGTPAPEIECTDLQGNVHSLSEFIGKPVYIDLWATWCGPCVGEIPHLAKFVESLGKNPEIVCVSISIDDERADWENFLSQNGHNWAQFIATPEGSRTISAKYNVTGIPRFMLLDAEGNIAAVNAPRPSDPDLLNKLRELL